MVYGYILMVKRKKEGFLINEMNSKINEIEVDTR